MIDTPNNHGSSFSSFIQAMERKAKVVPLAVAFETLITQKFEEYKSDPSTVHRWLKGFLFCGEIYLQEKR